MARRLISQMWLEDMHIAAADDASEDVEMRVSLTLRKGRTATHVSSHSYRSSA